MQTSTATHQRMKTEEKGNTDNSRIHLDVYIPRNIAQYSERYIHCHVKKRQTRQSPTPKEEQLAYSFIGISQFQVQFSNFSDIDN